MKKGFIALLGFLLVVIPINLVHAGNGYTLTSQLQQGGLLVTYTLPTTDKNKLFYLVFTPSTTTILNQDTKVSGSSTVAINNLKPGATASQVVTTIPTDKRYFVGLAARDAQGKDFYIVTPQETFLAADPATITKGTPLIVSSKINTTIHPDFKKFTATLYLDTVPLPDGVMNASGSTKLFKSKTDISGSTEGVAADGSLYWSLNDLGTEVKYYYKILLTSPTGKQMVTDVGILTSDKGKVATDAASVQSDFDSRSYRLLAPFPGLSVLLDPDLCEEQRSQKGKGGEICDINDFLNYMFKLLVSLAAVLLVLRLVYEGYQYIVTDIPFLKASAKSGFFEALGGLALALSAYLILNTINPKLVENSISLNKVAVGVDFEEGGDIPPKSGSVGSGKGGTGYDFKSIKFPAGIICPAKNIGAGTIPTIAQSFKGRVSYSQDARGTAYSSTVINLDCSSYVNTVLSCAGITPKTEAFTGDIFNGTEKIITVENKNGKYLINGIEVKVGDLIGWQAGGAKPYTSGGHVLIYIGDGTLMDVRSSPNPSVGENPIVKWANTRIQKKYSLYIRRI